MIRDRKRMFSLLALCVSAFLFGQGRNKAKESVDLSNTVSEICIQCLPNTWVLEKVKDEMGFGDTNGWFDVNSQDTLFIKNDGTYKHVSYGNEVDVVGLWSLNSSNKLGLDKFLGLSMEDYDWTIEELNSKYFVISILAGESEYNRFYKRVNEYK